MLLLLMLAALSLLDKEKSPRNESRDDDEPSSADDEHDSTGDRDGRDDRLAINEKELLLL